MCFPKEIICPYFSITYVLYVRSPKDKTATGYTEFSDKGLRNLRTCLFAMGDKEQLASYWYQSTLKSLIAQGQFSRVVLTQLGRLDICYVTLSIIRTGAHCAVQGPAPSRRKTRAYELHCLAAQMSTGNGGTIN